MPANNCFRSQSYEPVKPTAVYEFLTPELPPIAGSADYQRRAQVVGRAFREAHVETVLLVHGTFAGTDALGLISYLESLSSEWGRQLREGAKGAIDWTLGDMGNYSPAILDDLAAIMHPNGEPVSDPVREDSPGFLSGPTFPLDPVVRRFNWSSENNHVARADAAVRLIEQLLDLKLSPGQRILLLGHSHAGNVFALATNLVVAKPRVRGRFLDAAAAYRTRTEADQARWDQLRDRLLSTRSNPLETISLDLVTFGTPRRYGWDSAGYSQLLHFINHRPLPGTAAYLAAWPQTVSDVWAAAAGDYVQQLGIAGTDFPPNVFEWRRSLAEHRLRRLLQSNVRRRSLWSNLKAGVRVPDDGTTLLVDYSGADPEAAAQFLGHAIYTRRHWLLFHAEQIARRFYGLKDTSA